MPIAIAAAFSLATVVLVAGGLAARQGAAWGLIAAAIVLASPRFVTYAAWQFADIPLGFYIVATFVLIQRACESDRPRRWWILAGLAAGCAAWIKNEGTVFAVVALAVVGVWSLRRASGRSAAELGWLTLGALPGLLAVATFKIWLAPEDDYVRPLSVAWIASHIVDTARWLAVGEAFGRELWFNGAAMVGALPLLVVFVAICGIARPVAAAPLLCAATVLLVLAADALVYVITPFPLEWHLGTSLARVITQLWPALVWIGLLSARRL